MRRNRFFLPSPFPPLGVPPDSYAPASPGAFVPVKDIPQNGVAGEQDFLHPRRFDYQIIIAAPASGTTAWLLGDDNNAPATGGQFGTRIPNGCYGVVTGIFPYLEGGAGAVQGPRIPGAGVTIAWSLLIDNKIDQAFGRITTILAPWNSQENRPLVYIRSGLQLTCSVTPTDPTGLYSFVGIRIMGWIVPFSVERRAGVLN